MGRNKCCSISENSSGIDEISKSKRSCEGCEWVFYPPGAFHMPCVWERLLKMVKRSLKAILCKDLINEEVLQTVFTEAESITNSRSLTRISSSPDDNKPLTPYHFLNIRSSTNLPCEIVEDSDKYCRKRWKQAQILRGGSRVVQVISRSHSNVSKPAFVTSKSLYCSSRNQLSSLFYCLL